MKPNTRTFLKNLLRVPKNKDFHSNCKIILIQPNENWNDFKTRTLKYLRDTAKTQIGIPLIIHGMTAVHRCSPSNLSKPLRKCRRKSQYLTDKTRLLYILSKDMRSIDRTRTECICAQKCSRGKFTHTSVLSNF